MPFPVVATAATTFAGWSAKDDLHSGGASQSMWNRYWSGDTDWQRQIAGRPDLIPGGTVPWETGAVAGQSEWERGTGKGTTHMMTPAEVTEQARQSQVDAATQKRADDAYAAYLRRVERDKQAAAAHVSHLMGESPKKHRGDEAAMG